MTGTSVPPAPVLFLVALGRMYTGPPDSSFLFLLVIEHGSTVVASSCIYSPVFLQVSLPCLFLVFHHTEFLSFRVSERDCRASTCEMTRTKTSFFSHPKVHKRQKKTRREAYSTAVATGLLLPLQLPLLLPSPLLLPLQDGFNSKTRGGFRNSS